MRPGRQRRREHHVVAAAAAHGDRRRAQRKAQPRDLAPDAHQPHRLRPSVVARRPRAAACHECRGARSPGRARRGGGVFSRAGQCELPVWQPAPVKGHRSVASRPQARRRNSSDGPTTWEVGRRARRPRSAVTTVTALSGRPATRSTIALSPSAGARTTWRRGMGRHLRGLGRAFQHEVHVVGVEPARVQGGDQPLGQPGRRARPVAPPAVRPGPDDVGPVDDEVPLGAVRQCAGPGRGGASPPRPGRAATGCGAAHGPRPPGSPPRPRRPAPARRHRPSSHRS